MDFKSFSAAKIALDAEKGKISNKAIKIPEGWHVVAMTADEKYIC